MGIAMPSVTGTTVGGRTGESVEAGSSAGGCHPRDAAIEALLGAYGGTDAPHPRQCSPVRGKR